uniref:Secreted protein n=1 Tax=Mycena chlorophos TaxID=658473 RepID=A0ABQ0LGF5_MYCCL|nr:predicted protein [Mycena chlorophos]
MRRTAIGALLHHLFFGSSSSSTAARPRTADAGIAGHAHDAEGCRVVVEVEDVACVELDSEDGARNSAVVARAIPGCDSSTCLSP